MTIGEQILLANEAIRCRRLTSSVSPSSGCAIIWYNESLHIVSLNQSKRTCSRSTSKSHILSGLVIRAVDYNLYSMSTESEGAVMRLTAILVSLVFPHTGQSIVDFLQDLESPRELPALASGHPLFELRS